MAYPSEERLKNLEQQVSQLADQVWNGHSIEDTTFHGVIVELQTYATTYPYLKVSPYPPNTPPQTGDLTFVASGVDPSSQVETNARYERVYVLNLPPPAVESYYKVGQIITYWHYSGQTNQTEIVKGSYVTLWVDHGQELVKITSAAQGSGTYNGRRTMLWGQVGTAGATNDLSLPLTEAQIPTSDDCIVFNTLENGLTNSHYIPNNTWLIGLTMGVTTGDPGNPYKPAIAVSLPDLPVTLKITDTYGSLGGGSANGSGFYKAVVNVGITSTVNPNGSRLNLPDSDGMGGGESIGTGTVVFENVFENDIQAGGGSPANNIHLLPTDGSTFVEGRYVGTATDGTPVYRGYAVPQYWPQCDVTPDGGSNATLSMGGFTIASYTYTCKVPTTGTILLTMASPKKNRPQGVLTGPAQGGTLTINPAGHLLLVDTDEQLNIWTPCTLSS